MLYKLLKTDFILGSLLATFILGFTTILLLLWYSYRKHSYWKKIGIPFVKPLPLVGSIHELFTTSMHEVELNRYRKYGRIYGYYEGTNAIISVAEPEILRDVFVKDFFTFTGRRSMKTGNEIIDKTLSNIQGEDWKRVRTIVTPTFTTGKLKRMLGIFKECSRTLVENFKLAAEKNEPVDAKRIYGAFTMDIIASSGFSTKIDSHNDPNNRFVQNAREVLGSTFNWKLILIMLCPQIMKLFKINFISMEPFSFFIDVVKQLIEDRKTNKRKRNDFLQLLLDTAEELNEEGNLDLNEKDDILENYGNDENDQIFKQTALTKKTLSIEEVIAQCMLFFLAGYETTASTLAFASYNLALHPDLQEKLIQELDDVLTENNGELTYDGIQSMKYLDNVISETLRLYPPAIKLERIADEDYKLGDTGLTVPKGMLVTIPSYAMHRDPELYPNPEEFNPDRFAPEERSKRNQYAYLPFGAGPRNCVGMRFALLEIKVCLAHVVSNFRIKKCPQTQVPLEFRFGQGLLQPKEINLAFEIRTDTVKAL